jgi:hypothetical protein
MHLEQSIFISWINLLSRVSPKYCEPGAASSAAVDAAAMKLQKWHGARQCGIPGLGIDTRAPGASGAF